MKICIEATPIGVKTNDKGGVYRYIFHLIEAFSRIDEENSYTLFFNFFRKEHYPVFEETMRRLNVGGNFSVRLSRFPTVIQKYIEPPTELLAGRFDIFHGCFDYLRPLLHGKGVVTVHDIRYLESIHDRNGENWEEIIRKTAPSKEFYMTDYHNRDKLFDTLRATIKKTIRRADLLITVSEYSKSRIINTLGIAPEKVNVIHQGIDRQFAPQDEKYVRPVLKKHGINKPYLLYAGKFEPLKNIEKTLDAFKKVVAVQDVILVMAGQINWYYYVIRDKAQQLGIDEKIVYTGYIPDSEMIALYSGASVFVFPSLYEGFGLPLLEAMACGVPIVTSSVCSIPEVVGDAALYADPYSSSDIAEKIVCCLDEEPVKKSLTHKGLIRAQSFSWEDTARNTLQAYKTLCQ